MMSNDNQNVIIFSGEAFFESLRTLRKWWLILPLAIALIAAGAKWLAPIEYEAETVLAPSEERASGLADMAGGLAGLAGLAGLDLSSGKVNDTQMAVEVLKSRSFLYNFIDEHKLLPFLLDDFETLNEQEQQELWRGYNELRKQLEIEYDRAKGIVTLRLSHGDPEQAAQWLQEMVADINRYMRERERERVQQQINYLTRKAQEVQQADVQESLYRLLQEQYKRAMLVEVNDDYVFETIDPALAPHQPNGLSAITWFIIGLILGVILMLLLTLLHGYVRRN